MQIRKQLEKEVTGSSAPLQVLIPQLGIPEVLGRWRGSVAAPPKLLATVNWLVILQSSTSRCRIASFNLFFAFSSLAAKMPRTSASGDDTVVGQSVPSTTVDWSKGTGTTLSASSSDVNITGDAGKCAIVAKPARRFGIKGLTLIRAPT